MTNWLLDTNVISGLRRPKPEAKVVAFFENQPLEAIFLSVVTLAEIRFGIENLVDASERSRLQDWLAQTVRPMFERRILPVSEDIMFKWRLIVQEGRKVRHTYSQPDLIIAATASTQGMTVVSRDIREFERARVPVFNPWGDKAA